MRGRLAGIDWVRARLSRGAALLILPLAILPLALLTASAAAQVPPNDWILQPVPEQVIPPDLHGAYSGRGWNHMRWDPVAKKMILFDGYAEPPVYVFESIYANALWLYDPDTNQLTLEKLNHWTMAGGVTSPLPENATDPTPYDRHFYSCFVYSPSKNRAYLWSGANNTVADNSVGDTWTYDFDAHAWREITSPHPYTVYEQACTYDPYLETMILFGGSDRQYHGGDRTYAFDLNTETWSDRAPSPGPAPRTGQTLCFDPKRRVSWMFAGAPWGSAGNELWTYDAAANRWEQIPAEGPWPPERRFGSLAYDDRHDVFLMYGGVTADDRELTDTWLFDPVTRTWRELRPDHVPVGRMRFYSEDLEYDTAHGFFVLNLGGEFWFYRYEPASAPPDAPAPQPPTTGLRVLARVPIRSGATISFSIPRASDATVMLFDIRGRRVATLASGRYAAGDHEVSWSAAPTTPSGLYIARLSTPGQTLTRKFIVVR